MADEISVTISATVVTGEFRDQFKPGNKRYDQQDAQRVARTTTLTTNSTTAGSRRADVEQGLVLLHESFHRQRDCYWPD